MERVVPQEWLGKVVDVVIDRPYGSVHPQGWYRYPVNYGYVPGAVAGDGEPLDVYVLGVHVPISVCSGVVAAVVHREDDVEDKLVVTMNGDWNHRRIVEAVEFSEKFFSSVVVCRRCPGCV